MKNHQRQKITLSTLIKINLGGVSMAQNQTRASEEAVISGTFSINLPNIGAVRQMISSILVNTNHPQQKVEIPVKTGKTFTENPFGDDRLLTPEELAARLGVTKSWVYQRTGSELSNPEDRLPCIRLGRKLRFDLKKVMQWIENQNKKQSWR